MNRKIQKEKRKMNSQPNTAPIQLHDITDSPSVEGKESVDHHMKDNSKGSPDHHRTTVDIQQSHDITDSHSVENRKGSHDHHMTILHKGDIHSELAKAIELAANKNKQELVFEN